MGVSVNFWKNIIPAKTVATNSTNPIEKEKKATSCELERQPQYDTFIRNTNPVDKTAETKPLSREEKLNLIFEQTYEEVLADFISTNPNVANLNLPTPQIRLIDSFESETQTASYNFTDNEIILTKDYDKNNNYLVLTKNDGSLVVMDEVNDEAVADKLSTLQNSYPNRNIETFKLTQEEKEFQLKATIAHELRHYLQQHLIASTEGCNEEQKLYYGQHPKEMQKNLDNYLEACKKEGIKPNDEILNTHIPTYWNEYKPKNILPSDTTLKFTSNNGDIRNWSVSKDLFDISQSYMQQENSAETYYVRPTEIDAYNYESEYISKYASLYNVRPEIQSILQEEADSSIEYGLEQLEQTGFTFS